MHEYTDSVSLCKKETGVFTIRILTDYNRKKNFAKGLYKPSELVYNHAIDARHVFFHPTGFPFPSVSMAHAVEHTVIPIKKEVSP